MKKDNYFTGNWTLENLKLIAKDTNENGMEINVDLPMEQLKDEILENGNIGDTECRKLYENNNYLVFISIDSNTEVINIIGKNNLAETNYFEIN